MHDNHPQGADPSCKAHCGFGPAETLPGVNPVVFGKKLLNKPGYVFGHSEFGDKVNPTLFCFPHDRFSAKGSISPDKTGLIRVCSTLSKCLSRKSFTEIFPYD
jgi:hypothetical protein